MPLPPVATLAACGSIITAFKSGWELSRMIKKKRAERGLDSESKHILKELQNAYLDGLLADRAFEKYYDRFLAALAEKDPVEMRKIRKHIDLLRGVQDRITRDNTRANTQTVYDEKYHRRQYRRPDSVDRNRQRYAERHEERTYRRPANHLSLDTERAQREYYYSHALPSPYKGEIEYTPLGTEFHEKKQRTTEERRGAAGGGKTEYRARSTTVDDRGRQRTRSVHAEKDSSGRYKRSESVDSDTDENAHYRRRQAYYFSKAVNN